MGHGMIEVTDIAHAFGDTQVLDGVSFAAEKGSITALLGQNGAGKTTLVRILATLLRPDRGKATINGYDVVQHPERVRQSISLTGQFTAVDDLLTGRENMRIAARLWRTPARASDERIDELLNRFSLIDAADRRAQTWSGGMRRKLDLAISLLGNPAVLFLDEPTTGLDPESRHTLWRIVRQLANNGVTVLLTTQYLDEADHLADEVLMLHRGRIVASGSPASLKSQLTGVSVALTFSSSAQRDMAATLLAPSGCRVQDSGSAGLTVLTDGTLVQVNHILELLVRASIPAETLIVAPPTLDDVFMNLVSEPDAVNKELAS